MASFISALSLFVFVLISGCFTLPIGDHFLPETSSPFTFDATTETSVHERMFSDDATIAPFDGMTTEDATREPRMFNEVATDESFTFVPTTERMNQEPRMFNEESFTFKPTTERASHEPRMFNEIATEESFTFKPTTERANQEPRMFNEDATEESFTFKPTTERAIHEPRMFNEVATEESFTFKPTTERSLHEKRGFEDTPSDMTVEETTERDELALRDMPAETFTESSSRRFHSVDSVRPTTEVYRGIQGWSQPSTTVEPRMTASGMHMTFTTNSMPSMSSTIVPELNTRDSTTTRKYTGLLADKLDHEVESNEDDHEHKKLLGKDKFVEPKQEEKKLNKEKVVVEEPMEVNGKVKPELEEDKFEKITMAPKKFDSKKDMEHEENTPEFENVKTVEHKEHILDFKGPKEEMVKESHEEFKKHPKPEFEEMKKESHEEFKKHPKPEFDEMKKESHEEFKKLPKPELDEMKKESHEEFKKHPKPEFEEMKKESHEEFEKHPKPELEGTKLKIDPDFQKFPKAKFEGEKTLRTGQKFPMEESKKPVGKDSSEEKKTSYKQEGELEEDVYPEKFIPKRPTTPRRPQVDSDDNIEYPKALYFDKTWTSVVKIPSDFAILDETTDVVTVPASVRPSKTVDIRRDELKLNQGKESARAE